MEWNAKIKSKLTPLGALVEETDDIAQLPNLSSRNLHDAANDAAWRVVA